jgi:PhzF family phenazine biosynthesis protein
VPHEFDQVDVFSTTPFGGNPVAVVHAADDLDDATMAAFARWTNLSETTFVLRPSSAEADYRLRIFTVGGELPFAGHPTLGSCRAWLDHGGAPRGEHIVQECRAGLIRVRRAGDLLAFAAPPLIRSGVVDKAERKSLRAALGLAKEDVVDYAWVDNGPGWVGVRLTSAEAVLGLRPDFAMLNHEVAVIGPHEPGAEADFEVRCFGPDMGIPEDPVTGSANAGLAMWLIGSGAAPERYTVAQGTALGRSGRVEIERIGDTIWVGGCTRPSIRGVLTVA